MICQSVAYQEIGFMNELFEGIKYVNFCYALLYLWLFINKYLADVMNI